MSEAHHPVAAEMSDAPKSYGSGLIALWVVMLVNLAWFVPYALETLHGILSVSPPS